MLEPEEEAALARRRAEEEEAAEGGGLEEDDFDYGQADYELPSDFQALAKDLRLFPGIDPLEAPSDGSSVPLEIPGLPEDPGGGTDSTVQIMEIPKGLGTRVEDAELAFSIHPPMQWSREDGEGGRVQWTGPAQEDGFIPSLIIVSSEVSDWEFETAREAFKEEARSALPELEVIREGPVWIQDRETFQITGRAVIRRETDGAGEDVELSIRQILVPGAQRFWICTTFTSTTTDDEVLLVLERALQSLEFSASESADTGSTEPEPPSFPNDSGEEEEEN